MNMRMITVKQDDTGDFKTVTEAVASVNDATADVPYEILIYPGIYREKSIRMKDHVSLRGTDRDTCIIRGENPESATDRQITPISTIDWTTSGYIKDLTITCKNMRYPVHSDGGAYGNNDGRQEIINCRLEHLGNKDVAAYRAANGLPAGDLWGSLHAWGCGTSDGMTVIARDSTFISPTTAFYFHENMNFEKPSYVELTNCRMIATEEDGCAICVQGYGSGRDGKLVVNNCEINGYTDIYTGSWLPEKMAASYFKPVECTFAGGGNSLSPVRIYTKILALRITSSGTERTGTVRLGGSAARRLFGEPVYYDGAGGIPGYAEGTTDISDENPNTRCTALGHRLGDCTGTHLTLEISIDGNKQVSVNFDRDFKDMKNQAIIEMIQTALGSAGEICTVGIDLDYYPEYADTISHLCNTSQIGILKGMAVAHDSSFKNCRRMAATDDADDFAGVAMQDIRPGEFGAILVKGIIFDTVGGKKEGHGNHGILQSEYGATQKGDRFGIASEPGYFAKGGSPSLMKAIASHLLKFSIK